MKYLTLLLSSLFILTLTGCSDSESSYVPSGWECVDMEKTNVRSGYLESTYTECRKERGKPWRIAGKSVSYYRGYDVISESYYKILEDKYISVLHGTHQEWDINGQLKKKVEYLNGKENGTAQEWDPNGKLTKLYD